MWKEVSEDFWRENRESKVGQAEDTVREIIEQVRLKGDEALREYAKKFDKVNLDSLEVSREEIENAYDSVDQRLVDELENSAYNIQRFHEMQMPPELWLREVQPGVTLGVKTTPLERVGCYIPGGRASYPSTVLMTAIPARVAGVDEVIMCTPAPVNPLTLVAADIAGVDEIYKTGGAQAIAAMALGTESIYPVQKIVGPGNVFVTGAKMMLRNTVEIDFPAGPSEIGILADETAVPEYLAADLIAQAEHDPSSASLLITCDSSLPDRVWRVMESMIETAPRKEIILKALDNSGYILADDMDIAAETMNGIAPEHLSIQVKDPLDTLAKVRNGGSIFIGPYTPVAAGDYASGTNHVLPTSGNSAVCSGLNVSHFMKTSTVQMLSREGLNALADTIETLADAEGLHAHAESVRIRKGDERYGEEGGNRRNPGSVQSEVLHQPRTVLAGVQPSLFGGGERRLQPSAGEGEIPRHMLREYGRVLHDSRAGNHLENAEPRVGLPIRGLRESDAVRLRHRPGSGGRLRPMLGPAPHRAVGYRSDHQQSGRSESGAAGLDCGLLQAEGPSSPDTAGAGRQSSLSVHLQQLSEHRRQDV